MKLGSLNGIICLNFTFGGVFAWVFLQIYEEARYSSNPPHRTARKIRKLKPVVRNVPVARNIMEGGYTERNVKPETDLTEP